MKRFGESGAEADAPIGDIVFAVLGKEQSRFFVLLFQGFAGDPPAFEGGDVKVRSVSRGLEARAARGDAVDQTLAVGRDLVSAAQPALPSVSGDEGANAVGAGGQQRKTARILLGG